MTWHRILENWPLVEADVQQHYGIDLASPGLLEERSARWLRVRIAGLLGIDSRLGALLAPPEQKGGE